VLRRKLIESQEGFSILPHTVSGLEVFGFIGLEKALQGVLGRGFCGGPIQMSWSPALAFAWRLLGRLFKTFAVLCIQH